VEGALDLIAVMQTITYTLSRAHSIGILHLDIKPSNILVWNQSLVIADWGLSVACNHSYHASTSSIVTITHRSPELLAGLPIIGTFTDIWSAGVVMSELVRNAPIATLHSNFSVLFHWMSVLGKPPEDVTSVLASGGWIDTTDSWPRWPPRKASQALSRPIRAYVSSIVDDIGKDFVTFVLSQAIDGCLEWNYSKRSSALSINKLLSKLDWCIE
jgi:serine/threonine protein kinase